MPEQIIQRTILGAFLAEPATGLCDQTWQDAEHGHRVDDVKSDWMREHHISQNRKPVDERGANDCKHNQHGHQNDVVQRTPMGRTVDAMHEDLQSFCHNPTPERPWKQGVYLPHQTLVLDSHYYKNSWPPDPEGSVNF